MSINKVIGRYAPSPTGDLHLGNLRTALLAWLQVRLQGGEFLLRMDDLDQPRVVIDSADQILQDLEWLGLDWDGEVVYQSKRHDLYQNALEELSHNGLVYECFCSRKDIQQAASAPHNTLGVYSGTCLGLDSEIIELKRLQKSPALRVQVNSKKIEFEDGCLGLFSHNLSESCGDFVIKRADGLFAYQLATAVDDKEQGVTDVLRGADLLDSTARQIYLTQALDDTIKPPKYWHVPLMLDDQGERMAKRGGALSLAEWRAEGKTAPELITFLAGSLGLIDTKLAISAGDLLIDLSLEEWHQQIRSFSD